jgi:hypothetical protein
MHDRTKGLMQNAKGVNKRAAMFEKAFDVVPL